MKVSVWIDKNINCYELSVAQSFVFRVTRLNWQYGFFTSKSNNYQFIKSDISLVEPANPSRNTIIAKDSGLEKLVLPINAVRVNSSIQQMVRDTLYLEAGSRSIALYLFKQYPSYRNIDFSIQTYNRKIKTDGTRFALTTKLDTLFNRRISY
ncbi:hypothetical protein FA048_17730 [Pedobacter polaris]|uniref:Uncharacterized protein n=1 Tax=Pedobacter polaris TaxID=2571273 RepID=A0A4U1CKJ8_9SPHI|nr:hypothetical protein [Pedobacter polaris]TKC05564.1 hypothetical protein FA048_17730 [Pedobacter polaris]